MVTLNHQQLRKKFKKSHGWNAHGDSLSNKIKFMNIFLNLGRANESYVAFNENFELSI
jgi:hypothetical protein